MALEALSSVVPACHILRAFVCLGLHCVKLNLYGLNVFLCFLYFLMGAKLVLCI